MPNGFQSEDTSKNHANIYELTPGFELAKPDVSTTVSSAIDTFLADINRQVKLISKRQYKLMLLDVPLVTLLSFLPMFFINFLMRNSIWCAILYLIAIQLCSYFFVCRKSKDIFPISIESIVQVGGLKSIGILMELL